jgi:CRP/FNR family transcriptional regulator
MAHAQTATHQAANYRPLNASVALAKTAPEDREFKSVVVPMPGAADSLQRIGRTIQIDRGQTVVTAGDTNTQVFKVQDGVLRVVRILPDGRRHIAKFLNAGDFFGLSDATECDSNVEAITPCALTRYQRRDFDNLVNADAAAGAQLLRLVFRQLDLNNRLLLSLGRKTASERLASFLLSFVPHNAANCRDVTIDLPMCRSDIADHLGLTIETVSRLITKFRQRRLINLVDCQTVKILSLEALEELAAD